MTRLRNFANSRFREFANWNKLGPREQRYQATSGGFSKKKNIKRYQPLSTVIKRYYRPLITPFSSKSVCGGNCYQRYQAFLGFWAGGKNGSLTPLHFCYPDRPPEFANVRVRGFDGLDGRIWTNLAPTLNVTNVTRGFHY